MKKKMVLAAVLFSALLLLPVVTADVYVPPGPGSSLDAWIISPWHVMPDVGPVPFYLWVVDLQDGSDVGWYYTDGPVYDPILQKGHPKIEKSHPWVPWENKLDIPWSTEVMILGFIPGVVVAPDQAPPDVELVITWNGIPWVVTLHTDNIVGYDYPPKFYDDIHDTYEFAWPQESPYKDAYYNIWVGDAIHLMEHFGEEIPPEWYDIWYEVLYGTYNGLWFWYTFHPNVGDWIAYNCEGETKFPPTYDITALFEYGTSQIWFPHVAFDVSLLEVHKTVDWVSEGQLMDVVTIENVGKENATELDFTQTFPGAAKHGVIPDYASAKARIDGNRTIGWKTLTGFGDSWPYVFPEPFDDLMPGEIMTITLKLEVYNFDGWFGTIVFDSMVSAKEIPPWKEPIALHSVTIGEWPQRFAVVIGDAAAHAAPSGINWFDEPTAYGGDPGRDEIMFTDDDLDYWPVLQKIAGEGITVFAVDYSIDWLDAWWTFDDMAWMTGGVHYLGGEAWDTLIVDEIIGRIGPDGRADVIFTVDLSASMAGDLGDVQTKIKSIIDNLPGTMDVTFGLGTHVDYPGWYDSYGYSAQYGSWLSGDYAWKTDLDLTHDRALAKSTVDTLSTRNGMDFPQNYVRVLFELQFFSRGHVPLWFGWKLYYEGIDFVDLDGHCPPWRFDMIPEWWVPLPILRDKLTHPPPAMTLDPIPVDLNGDGTINAEDVSLVRQAIVGLVAYDLRMDINVNGEIDTQDLAAYKLEAN